MSKTTKTILAVILLLVVAAAIALAYFQWGPPAQTRAEEARRAEAAQQAEQPAAEPTAEQPAEEAQAPEEAAAPAEEQPAEEAQAPEEAAASAEEQPQEEPAGTEEAPAVTITFLVVHGDASEKEFVITTTGLTLREALEQEGLIEGTESEWGLYVLTVDGETADEEQQQWWCLTKDGEMSMTGVDDTVIADGEHYEFTLTTGW